MRPLLSFCAIFKNEAATVRKTLGSVKSFIDNWAVLDTGSSDGTEGFVVGDLADIPGTLRRGPFVDYATARNSALDLVTKNNNPAVFSLMMSADETLEGGEALRSFLEQHRDAPDGAYCVMMQTGSRMWPYSRVLRTDAGWKYVGKIHERPVGPNGEVTGPLIPGVVITHTPSDPERKIARLRDLDLPLLTAEVNDESKSLEERAHAMFFLAETHASLAGWCPKGPDGEFIVGGPWLSHQMTAMAYYFRYAQIAENPNNPAHDHDKAMYALFLYYHLAEKINLYTSPELVSRLEMFVNAAPKLAEARFMLADHAARIDVRQGLFHALQAVDVAKAARINPTHEAMDNRIEWLSLMVAAQCAKQLKKDEQAKDLAERGIAAGGPREAFEGVL